MKIYHFTFMLALIGIISLISLAVINNNISFDLKGDRTYIISVGETYNDIGFNAKIFNKDISKKVTLTNNININKIGNYNIYYNLKILGKNYELIRTINVVDDTIPEIKLNGEDTVTIYVGEEYKELGATATDNYDGDISENIIIDGTINTEIEGTYKLKYIITDSSGNENIISRNVVVRKKQPPKNTITNENNNLNDPIVKYIKENNYKVSIGYYNLYDNSGYYYEENKIYYGASLIKTLDAIYLYDNNLVTNEIEEKIEKAISVSDNDSHHFLVNYIGKQTLKNYGISLGAFHTLQGNDNYGNTTVMDQITYLKKLYLLINNNNKLKSFFINNYGNYIKFNEIEVMHKYGYYGSYFHDIGIVLDDTPYIIVVLTQEANNNHQKIINDISKLIYEHHKK